MSEIIDLTKYRIVNCKVMPQTSFANIFVHTVSADLLDQRFPTGGNSPLGGNSAFLRGGGGFVTAKIKKTMLNMR